MYKVEEISCETAVNFFFKKLGQKLFCFIVYVLLLCLLHKASNMSYRFDGLTHDLTLNRERMKNLLCLPGNQIRINYNQVVVDQKQLV